MDKKTAFIILAVVIAGLIVWNVSKNKAQEQKEWEQELRMIQCQDDAYKTYLEDWNTACNSNMLADGCRLLSTTSSRLDEVYQKALDRCVVMYK